jgi:hypothetical protein
MGKAIAMPEGVASEYWKDESTKTYDGSDGII